MAMEQMTRNVTIRPWRIGDDDGVWSVLQDGSYSNVKSTFMIILQKPLLRIITILLFCVGLAYRLPLMLLILGVVTGIVLIYLMSFIGALVYLYGSTLSDIKNIKQSYFENPDHHFWVAECDGEIAGTIAIVQKVSRLKGSPSDLHSNNLQDNKVAWLRRMAVKRNFRGLGIAKKLVSETIEFCRNREYDSVFLITTEVHHAARSLYSSMGFQLIAQRPYRYLRGLVTVKTYEFEMTLKC